MKRNLLRRAAIIAAMVFCSAAGLGSAQAASSSNGQTLFGITWFGNQVIAIDPATGEGRALGALGDVIFSYGIAARDGKLYTFDQVHNRIREINLVNGALGAEIDVGFSGLQGEGDLTFRSDGVGFLVSNLNAAGVPVNDLYTFDVAAHTSQRIGSLNVSIDGLAFDSTGKLYGLGQGDATLYTIDTTTAVATPVGPLGVDMNSPISGMAFAPKASDGTENIYAAIDDRLYVINKDTGAATLVSNDVLDFGVSSVSGLVFAPGAAVLGNISTRAFVGNGDDVTIAGFIIRGTPDKKVLLRGIGPSLAEVPGKLSDPVIELFDGAGASLARNDNWQDTQQTEIAATGLAPSDPKEAAIVRTLPEGNFTVVLSGANGANGIGLIEAYDANLGNAAQLVNLSTRGRVDTGDNILIGGVIVSGSGGQQMVFRALGPSLASSDVPNPLADPTLDVMDANGQRVAFNNDWRTDQETEIKATGLQPSNDKESAIVTNLAPGSYTAIVRGVDSTGIGLVESYNVGANSTQ